MTYKVPEDVDAERVLLATICQQGAESAALECCGAMEQEDFMHPAHRAIFNALRDLLGEGVEVSLSAILDAGRRNKSEHLFGGRDGLFEILDSGPEVAKPMVLVAILKKHRRRRELL